MSHIGQCNNTNITIHCSWKHKHSASIKQQVHYKYHFYLFVKLLQTMAKWQNTCIREAQWLVMRRDTHGRNNLCVADGVLRCRVVLQYDWRNVTEAAEQFVSCGTRWRSRRIFTQNGNKSADRCDKHATTWLSNFRRWYSGRYMLYCLSLWHFIWKAPQLMEWVIERAWISAEKNFCYSNSISASTTWVRSSVQGQQPPERSVLSCISCLGSPHIKEGQTVGDVP